MAAALAVNAGLLALYYFPTPKRLIGDEIYYFNLGSAIANNQPAQHDPLWPPLYGELLGATFSQVGIHLLVVQIAQIVLWLVTGYLLFRIVEKLLGERIVATIALGLYLFSPELMAFSHYLWPETLHLFLVLAALWLVICHPRYRWTAAAAGVLLGLALLTKSLLLPLLPVLLLFMLLVKVEGINLRGRALRAALLASAALATVALFLAAIPNGRGEVTLAGSVTFNAWVGLNDSARVDTQGVIVGQAHLQFVAAGPDLTTRNAIYNQKIRDLLRRQGIVNTLAQQAGKQYFRLFDHQTFLTTQLPNGPRAAYSFDAPLLANGLLLYSAIFHAVVLASGVLGMTFVRGYPWSWLQFFLLFLLYNLAIFLVLHVITRYVVQLLPLWMVFAAVVLASGATWLHSHRTLMLPGIVISRVRLAVGAMLALAILTLAFGSVIFRP
jgi:4-amino-4-deoxy-L-arabinose transferase-like glycosyltransferase